MTYCVTGKGPCSCQPQEGVFCHYDKNIHPCHEIIFEQSKNIGSLEGALEQQQARFERIKPAWEMLAKKIGRFTADPLDERLILEEAANEIDRLRERWDADRTELNKINDLIRIMIMAKRDSEE